MTERWRCDWCGGEWDEDESDPLPPSKDILGQCPVSGCYWCGDECCGAYCYPVIAPASTPTPTESASGRIAR